MNYKEEDKKLIESANCHYYEFTEEMIKKIVSKNINDVTGEEWRTLIQMLYPKNMVGSGLFQPILIFKISPKGKRVDPPLEAYNSINDLVDNNCLLFRIMKQIEKKTNIKIHDSWNKAKDTILRVEEEKEKTNES